MDESDLTCPVCSSKSLERGTTEIEVPHFGNVILYYLRCRNCGYRINDFSYQGDFPKEDRVEINNTKDLEIKIVRGSSGTVLIPELGLELFPGPLAESFITNVEGLLNRFLQLMPLFDDPAKVDETESRIHDAISGKLRFTITLSDPTGVSHFIRN
ncbi:MAG: ZPR1 zinc finger domain-containing protein [Thermoplasmatales archaeon]